MIKYCFKDRLISCSPWRSRSIFFHLLLSRHLTAHTMWPGAESTNWNVFYQICNDQRSKCRKRTTVRNGVKYNVYKWYTWKSPNKPYPNLPIAAVLRLLYSPNSRSEEPDKCGKNLSSTCFFDCIISPLIPTWMSNNGWSLLGMKPLRRKRNTD